MHSIFKFSRAIFAVLLLSPAPPDAPAQTSVSVELLARNRTATNSIGRRASSEAATRPTPRQRSTASRERVSPLAIPDIGTLTPPPSPAPSPSGSGEATGGSYLSALDRYRAMPREKLSDEISRLQQSVDTVTSDSSQRRDLLDLINILEVRRRSGVDVDALIREITDQVVQLRGLKLLRPVQYSVLDRAGLKELLAHEIQREFPAGKMKEIEFSMKLLGALPEKTDLEKTLVGMLSEQIAGLYDPRSKRLYVMREFDLSRVLARIILAHEICHAIQDQHFNLLPMLERGPDDSEAALAAQCIVEGDATVLMQEYAATTVSTGNLLELLDVFHVDQRAYNRAPYFLKKQLVFPYLGGAEFMQRVVVQGSATARDDVFRRPPASSEQILHPEKYSTAGADQPTTFTLPDISSSLGAGWKLTYRTALGELAIRTLFENWREWDAGKRAGDGWDGDRMHLYRNGSRFAMVWMSCWDTRADAEDYWNLTSELLRTKVYRGAYADKPFPDTEEGMRRLPLDPAATGEKAPVRFELRMRHKRVLLIAADSEETLVSLQRVENSLFEASKPPGGL